MILDPSIAILLYVDRSSNLVIITLSEKSIVCMHLRFFMFHILTLPLSSALTTIGVLFTRVKQVTADSCPRSSPFSEESR